MSVFALFFHSFFVLGKIISVGWENQFFYRLRSKIFCKYSWEQIFPRGESSKEQMDSRISKMNDQSLHQMDQMCFQKTLFRHKRLQFN